MAEGGDSCHVLKAAMSLFCKGNLAYWMNVPAMQVVMILEDLATVFGAKSKLRQYKRD